ncbi:DJ-1/PfpI family protein [Angustibacter sp. McL0619]|uniref:DJ-1/PfpI family protein n=1 Tax=Angustibacter sp. McL0619 TaxID=3415676 RepID=UPI003CFA5414
MNDRHCLEADDSSPDDRRRRQIGLILFNGVEELDAVGPWEVLSAWTQQHPEDGWDIFCLSTDGRPVRGARSLMLGAQHSIDDVPVMDVLVHPGGPGIRPMLHDHNHLEWVRRQRAAVPLMTSVSTGSLVYAAAGLLVGRRATTHWDSLNLLSELDPTVVTDVSSRFVDDGDLITSAGVSSGIDMALHLVARLADVERARTVRSEIQYPVPPI